MDLHAKEDDCEDEGNRNRYVQSLAYVQDILVPHDATVFDQH